MQKDIKIAVIGGTGKVGKYLVKQLINQGFKIKLLIRNPEKFELTNSLIEIIPGNVIDYESVYKLIEGCNAVISTLGQTKNEKPVFSLAVKNIIKAMSTVNISRYIVITGLTLDTPFDKKSIRTRLLSKMIRLLFKAIIIDKQKEYSLLSGSNLDWTIVRLPFIEQVESDELINISLTDCPGKKISATSLANFLIKQLESVEFIRKCPFISN